MATFVGALAMIGWLGALTFMLLFVFHPSTRDSRRDRKSRLFWFFIVADSAVMLMIYTTALMNIFLHDWPLRDPMRVLLGVSSLFVIWWRVAMFWGLNMRKRQKATREEASGS